MTIAKQALALETSSREPSVAVEQDGRVVTRRLRAERAHASDLLPAIDAARRELGGTSPPPLHVIAVGLGPGSYTGLRVGLATAQGMARASDCPLVGIPSLEALAYAQLAPGERGSVLLNARAGAAYFAAYERTKETTLVLTDPCAIALEEVLAKLPAEGPVFLDPSLEDLLDFGEETRTRLRRDCVATAESVLALGLQRISTESPVPLSEIEPLYLRAFQAKKRRR